jgi:hypothetical protein
VNVLYIYGPPGVGKRTVGVELAALTGYRLCDNHTTIGWARGFFEFGSEPMWKLEHALRAAIFGAAAEDGLDLVGTFLVPSEAVMQDVRMTIALAGSTGGRVDFVRLYCDQDELERRVQQTYGDEQGRPSPVEALRGMQQTHDFALSAPGQKTLELDNTHLAPADAARIIATYFAIPLR